MAAHDAQQASGPEAQQRADVLRAQLQQYCILSSDDAFRCVSGNGVDVLLDPATRHTADHLAQIHPPTRPSSRLVAPTSSCLLAPDSIHNLFMKPGLPGLPLTHPCQSLHCHCPAPRYAAELVACEKVVLTRTLLMFLTDAC